MAGHQQFVAGSNTGSREACLTAGCDDYMTTPIGHVALLATVTRLLQPVFATSPA